MSENIPLLRFSEFKDEWKLCSIENAVEKLIDYRGKTPKKTDTGIPLITAKIINNGKIDEPTEFIAERDYNTWMRRGLPKVGDVLITTEAPLGEVAQLDENKIALAQRIIVLRGKKHKFSNNFLYYALQAPLVQDRIHRKGNGSTVFGIKQKELKKILLPDPAFFEQNKIASFLSKVDEKIEKLEEKQQIWETYKKGIIKQIFNQKIRFKDENGENYPDWEEKKLKEVALINDGTHFTPYYKDEGIPFFSVETVVNGVNPKYISKEEHQKLIKRCKPEKGNILLTRIGTLAKSKIVDWDYEFSIYVSLALIKTKKVANPRYLNQYFKSEIYQKDFMKKSLLLATPMKINVEDLKGTVIFLPEMKEQIKIAKFLTAIDAKIEALNKELELNREFKKGLLQKMFC